MRNCKTIYSAYITKLNNFILNQLFGKQIIIFSRVFVAIKTLANLNIILEYREVVIYLKQTVCNKVSCKSDCDIFQQQEALVNPYTYTTQDNLSSSMQQKASINPTHCPTQNTFPFRLQEWALVNQNPSPTQNTFSSIFEMEALAKPNTTYSVQKKLDYIQASEFSAWDPFPFKYHPELLSDIDENSDDDEEFEGFMNIYKT